MVLQMACANPTFLAHSILTDLRMLRTKAQGSLDYEERKQRVAASATTITNNSPPSMPFFNSQGFPYSSLVAPVPITAKKLGRSSSKRARAAVEGVASKPIQVVLPATAVVAPAAPVFAAVAPLSSSSSPPPEVQDEGEISEVPQKNTRRREVRRPKRLREEDQ